MWWPPFKGNTPSIQAWPLKEHVKRLKQSGFETEVKAWPLKEHVIVGWNKALKSYVSSTLSRCSEGGWVLKDDGICQQLIIWIWKLRSKPDSPRWLFSIAASDGVGCHEMGRAFELPDGTKIGTSRKLRQIETGKVFRKVRGAASLSTSPKIRT